MKFLNHLKSKPEIFIVLFLIGLTLAVQAWLITPPYLSDQINYLKIAEQLFDSPVNPMHRSLRLGILLPTAIMIKLFNYSEISYYAMPFVSLVGLVMGVYLLTRSLFSKVEAFFAAVLTIFLPNILFSATYLLPDIPGTACLTLGIAVLVYFARNQISTSPKARNLLLCLSGFLLGWAYRVDGSLQK